MIKVGILSDTHTYLDQKILYHFKDCDEIWHAGDFGNLSVSNELEAFKPLKGVYGNIDGTNIRAIHPLDKNFVCGGLNIWLTHIGGYPGRYDKRVRDILNVSPPDIFVCGHSHILKVVKDPKFSNMLILNPGAAGKQGLHKIRTVIRFTIDQKVAENVEVIELGARGAIH